MTTLTRKLKKLFAKDAANNGQFGSAAAGTFVDSNDVDTIQALPAFSTGWDAATLAGEKLPTLEETQALKYEGDYQLVYLLQEGIAEYNSSTVYSPTSIVKAPSSSILWKSKLDNNTGNALVEGVNWALLGDLSALSNPLYGKNVIINGDFNIIQGGSSFAAAANGDYTLDQWQYNKVGAMVHTISQDADVPTVAQAGRLFKYSLKIACTTVDSLIAAGDYAEITQKIEGFNWAPLAQKVITRSFWFKATKTGQYGVSIRNSGLDRSYVGTLTVNVSDTWEYKTVTFTASPSAGTWDYADGIGAIIGITLVAGSNFQTTAGTWQTGNYLATSSQVNACDSTSNDVRICADQLEAGAVATSFEQKAIAEELSACQRYFEKSYNLAVSPGTITNAGQVVFSNQTGQANPITIGFRTSKRGPSIIKLYSPATGAVGKMYDGTIDKNASGFDAGDSGFFAALSSTAVLSNLYVHWTASSRL